MYRLLFTTLLRRLPAETVHRLSFRALGLLAAVPGALPLLRRRSRPRDAALRVRALGLDFPSPVGLAAGFDKDAEAYEALGAFGFGFVEIGTVTARPQPGNPKPRLFRLVKDRAIVNRMGFNNEGARAAADRLRGRRTVIVGVNIGKTKVVPEHEAIADYVESTERLAALADYLVVNVSSPNTPGLRDLQAVEHLEPLLKAVRAAADRATPRRVPLLVKIAPDLADADIDAIADLALTLGLDGIIATNTTISRDGLAGRNVEAAGAGGLSGAPLKARSLAVLRRLRERVGDRLVLVSVGGIETADEAWERLQAGATLVQVYTGLIYGGPSWPRRINRGLAGRLRGEDRTTA
ncbi:quinone-dependent dihydroorotate dehydrogenase [Actinomadura sp. DC4]|uniref:quinone-dependent dihydroorotate dehydrogenase n=1 Tax=Actinomadura sp. DC4 TaxID=3055069 RepID=UPI0025B21130|nr:quinone-dependent dihydroorotate dehydrogenase [Actinomadura sp. DC4]MDN3353879.1 quinone-dependent dihydroorotate dehydrogenase [Actinomadura sp. DC4]